MHVCAVAASAWWRSVLRVRSTSLRSPAPPKEKKGIPGGRTSKHRAGSWDRLKAHFRHELPHTGPSPRGAELALNDCALGPSAVYTASSEPKTRDAKPGPGLKQTARNGLFRYFSPSSFLPLSVLLFFTSVSLFLSVFLFSRLTLFMSRCAGAPRPRAPGRPGFERQG